MRIIDLLDIHSIALDAKPATKREALDQAISLMEKSGKLRDKEAYRRQVYRREEESTTGIGEGLAIPHGKSGGVAAPGLAAMVVRQGVDFDSLDGEPVHLMFLIAAPDTEDNVHLDVLSRLSVLLMDQAFTERLMKAETPEQFLRIIDETEREKTGKKEADETHSAGILAVTSCPTGIAHTYMAAEGLEKAAKAKNCRIKVETRGSGGAKNVLTEEEIDRADCIIVAADASVPMERFYGKRVIECRVSDGIARADELVARAIRGDAPIYLPGGSEEPADAEEVRTRMRRAGQEKKTGSFGHRSYTRLMNGVSHMLPFVVGGGILIALAFLIDGLLVDMDALSAAERADFGSITPIAASLKQIGDLAFGLMLPVLAGYIALSIADRPALAPGFVGGLIAANGKSGFLGALAAGFLAGYLILLLRSLFERLPDALEKIAPVLLYPLFGILIMGLVMNWVIEPPVGALNTGLNRALTNMGNSSRLILGMIVAGMMSVDMGGPFNKAAYVFGTASIAAGNYDIMAAVMVGGMVPPCAIALSTMLFRDKFTKEERESGPVNFLMGLAFISEGAIPFAASDPLRVLPSCIIGSAVSGALSMAFGCTLMAPHGGIFVFPVVGHAWLYLAALAAGTAAGAVLLGVLKKRVTGGA